MGPTGEDGRTIEKGDEGGEEGSMSGGKAVSVALMNAASERRREDEDQRGASWSTEETAGRWQARTEALAGEWRIAWLNVSGSSPQSRVVSIKPGGVGSQVTFMRAHLMDAACHKLH